MAKVYKRKGFEEKILINLANITKNKNDTFRLVRAEICNDYTCELCEHKHLAKKFIILNNNTEKVIEVGSECVHHFAAHGVDMDTFVAIQKRMEKSIRDARNVLIEKLGKIEFDAANIDMSRMSYKTRKKFIRDTVRKMGEEKFRSMDKVERNKILVNAYRSYEAIRLLQGQNGNKDIYVYSVEEASQIIHEGELAAAELTSLGYENDIAKMQLVKDKKDFLENLKHYFDPKVFSVANSTYYLLRKEAERLDMVFNYEYVRDDYKRFESWRQNYAWLIKTKVKSKTIDKYLYWSQYRNLDQEEIDELREIIRNGGEEKTS